MAKFQFTIFVVLLTFVAVTTAISINNEPINLEKRTKTCPSVSKRNTLNKRYEDTICKCSLAESIFSSSIKGLFFFSQDECGSTTISGMFSHGFEVFNTSCITFEIVDSYNRTLYDLTDGLNVQFNNDGSTDPFAHTFHEINLDCFENGILFPQVGKNSKRQETGDSGNKSAVKNDGEIVADPLVEGFQ
ncbi:3464_t:CDS:1 [Funneliformis geosporum]|uniref:127_t:CDS:1 n=1 Tax=Funneliformis geosporum TaxID=1117311 RepID=A0A9W4SS35_9GLOM|nr:3464_t:CDS:1 [Funneliformis geosporum]CAI2177135.1 127_t:CDS:1 [Funneliformis geosporum]